jgi:hypothetical protein
MKKTVIILNSFAICLLALSFYRNFSTYQYAKKLLGEDHSGIIFFVLHHIREFSIFLGEIAILLGGIFLEVVRAKTAVVVNFGVPFVALICLLVGYAKIWPHYDGEAQIGLILVVLPVFLVCVVYGFLYRREFRGWVAKP